VKYIVDRKKFIVLLDSRAKVNVISSDIYIKLELPINKNVSLNIIEATG